jgi:hypothetical protein
VKQLHLLYWRGTGSPTTKLTNILFCGFAGKVFVVFIAGVWCNSQLNHLMNNLSRSGIMGTLSAILGVYRWNLVITREISDE